MNKLEVIAVFSVAPLFPRESIKAPAPGLRTLAASICTAVAPNAPIEAVRPAGVEITPAPVATAVLVSPVAALVAWAATIALVVGASIAALVAGAEGVVEATDCLTGEDGGLDADVVLVAANGPDAGEGKVDEAFEVVFTSTP